jgi:hypothetical protein
LFQVIPRTWVHCLLLSAQKPAEWKRARTPTERHKCIAKKNYNPNPRGGSDAFIWKCSFRITGGPESPHVERGRGLKELRPDCSKKLEGNLLRGGENTGKDHERTCQSGSILQKLPVEICPL